MTPVVTALAIAAVKGTQLRNVDSVDLDVRGVRENRRFFLIDERDEMVNATHLGALNTIVSEYSDAERRLSLRFDDGRVLEDEVRLGEEVETSFYRQPTRARLVLGDWSDAVSDLLGQPLRLVEAGPDGAVDRRVDGAATLISRGSLERLAEAAKRSSVDARRFRMLIEIDGVEPHGEDGWVGCRLRVGETVLRGRGHVGRCVITNRHPETGEIDLQTLRLLGGYRREVETTEPVAFGIYGDVVEPGRIRVGDPVAVDHG